MKKRALSELECFVLGLIWQAGPCSAYDVRRQMASSPSTQWSASAGAIYPLVQELERLGLLSSKAEKTGRRARRMYKITPSGVRALRAWIGPPLGAEAITVAYEPLRSRARFLEILDAKARTAWVDAAIEALEEVKSRVERWDAAHGGRDRFSALLTRNGQLDVAMRRQWLAEVRKSVERDR